jgi:hypothetical protein
MSSPPIVSTLIRHASAIVGSGRRGSDVGPESTIDIHHRED